MTVTAINYLNIVLMMVSVVLAYFFPFELFLFSYAILGPLHYTTEIGWLHKRQYFTNASKDYYLLLAIALVVVVLLLADVGYKYLGSAASAEALSPYFRVWLANMIVMAFIASFAMVTFKDTANKLIFTFVGTGVLLLVHSFQPYLLILAMLLPTMLHVTLFMVAFILYGALKGKSISGYLSVVVFIVCCFIFFLFTPNIPYKPNAMVMGLFNDGPFITVNRLFVGSQSLEQTLFSPIGIQVQRLIAFSYTYHYLNWFSKTKIIDWNNVTPRWRWFSICSWVVFVALYFIDFKTGIVAVFLLSMLHVFFEFPLNFRTFIFIGREAFGGIKGIIGK